MRHYQRLYTVHPVECQPQWPDEPQPIRPQWGKGFLAVAILAFGFLAVVDAAYAAWLLGGGV